MLLLGDYWVIQLPISNNKNDNIHCQKSVSSFFDTPYFVKKHGNGWCLTKKAEKICVCQKKAVSLQTILESEDKFDCLRPL